MILTTARRGPIAQSPDPLGVRICLPAHLSSNRAGGAGNLSAGAIFTGSPLEIARGIEDQWGTFLRSALPGLLAAIAGFWVSGYQGIPNLVALVLVCALGAHLVMSRTRFGMQLYAIGGNPEAAALAGIDVRNVIFSNFVIAGLFYGIAGIALTARVSGSVPGSAGLFLELDAIAAAIIGGTALAGAGEPSSAPCSAPS